MYGMDSHGKPWGPVKIVGWQVYEKESSALAADLMINICQRESIQRDQVVLHSDNGSPMKGATMLATLQELGIMPTLTFDIFAYHRFITMFTHRTRKIPITPKLPSPENFPDIRAAAKYFASSQTLNHLHNFLNAIHRHRLD